MAIVSPCAVFAAGCSSDGQATCAEMRSELATLAPPATQNWDDINALQKSVERALKLQSDIAARCR
jgi:hypothetical protein